MGFLAAELDEILKKHYKKEKGSHWSLLAQIHVHPQQIERLRFASEEFGRVASLQGSYLLTLKDSLSLDTKEWARLQAAVEADKSLRMFLYHKLDLDEAMNKANAVFSGALHDLQISFGASQSSAYADTEPDPPDTGAAQESA